MTSTFDLGRFVEAQDGAYETARQELAAGRKRSHWMWYIFPQIRGLGQSAMSQRYAIATLEEAQAYHAHPVLGARLVECTRLVLEVEKRTAREIFSTPDDLKFRSSMTLFEQAANDPEPFRAALLKYFDGEPDARTLAILKGGAG